MKRPRVNNSADTSQPNAKSFRTDRDCTDLTTANPAAEKSGLPLEKLSPAADEVYKDNDDVPAEAAFSKLVTEVFVDF